MPLSTYSFFYYNILVSIFSCSQTQVFYGLLHIIFRFLFSK